ncbi:cyclin-D1-1-like isoform X2 [Zingiber officinale]|uniref:cyclin-D1-1-like isoform X2 n=1 Tax=Zingiber officinale TaxID=94328 RepID=UPI001C4D3190|nr:cyclin-D1-1-like isoform X2 [Zingiber officinale]
MPPSTSTSSASSGCFDLHCTEDAGELVGYRGDADNSISVEGEEAAADTAGSVRFPVESVDPAARRDAVDWILKVRARYRFRPLTAYLAVIYVDRFLASHRLQQNGWALQLLSVACLSLGAKMEETLVPTLLDLQVEDAKFIFEPRTVLRMELLVLTALDWQLQTVSPFSFVDFFACKIDSSGKRARVLASKATQIILAAMREIDTASHSPSALAAAAVICVINETRDLAVVNPTIAATWCIGLTEMISLCLLPWQYLCGGQ